MKHTFLGYRMGNCSQLYAVVAISQHGTVNHIVVATSTIGCLLSDINNSNHSYVRLKILDSL